MNSPGQNNGFVVTHLAKDCIAYHQHITLEAQRWIEQDGYLGDHDDDHDSMQLQGAPYSSLAVPKRTKIDGYRSNPQTDLHDCTGRPAIPMLV